MEKILNIDMLHLYKEAKKRLEENGIPYDAAILLKSPDLCREIIRLVDYNENEDDIKRP